MLVALTPEVQGVLLLVEELGTLPSKERLESGRFELVSSGEAELLPLDVVGSD